MSGLDELKAFLKAISGASELSARRQRQADLLAKSLEDNGKLGRREIMIFHEVMDDCLRVLRRTNAERITSP